MIRTRDATTLPLIRKAIEQGVPLLAICRGIQELNVALDGTLATEIQERDGSLDHRAPVSDNQDERFAIRQSVSIKPGSCLAGVFGAGEIMVNSVHRQGDRPPGCEAAGRGRGGRRHDRGRFGQGRAGLRRRRAMASRILGAQRFRFGEDLSGIRAGRPRPCGSPARPACGGRVASKPARPVDLVLPLRGGADLPEHTLPHRTFNRHPPAEPSCRSAPAGDRQRFGDRRERRA